VTSGSVTSLREAVRDAVRTLSDAGIDSAEFDAMALAAAALGTTTSEVHKLMIMGAPVPQGFDDLVAERARRVPLLDVYRSSGPGGQSVNTTDSAVRITHLPTGTVVSCQNEKSQLQNKESAMRVLRARLHQLAQDEADAVASAQRKSQIRTVDRSERIRTYNFPENRIADHRTGYKAYNLDVVLDGDLDPVVQSAVDSDDAARMAAVADGSSGL